MVEAKAGSSLMFKKVLIANRGEIAVRLIRACREMEISPVAIYSEADRQALHVRLADEAYYVGESPATRSYLQGDRIIAIAKACGAEAIHPGYGFLSEREGFARAVLEAGLVFIGPSPESIARMGDKTNARQAAIAAGVQIVPGSQRPIEGLADARQQAGQIGYPVMLKASAGGGGKGMRIVRQASEIDSALTLAAAEAEAAFGDAAVYLEKYIERPRHIEIQLIGDQAGTILHLGERECSIQRRHQKVIEECPATWNDPDLREQMGRAAVAIARETGYYSLGTIEFLVDTDRQFYFLEMNTRLQVEHPVTEMVTGIDLVREQIRIAAGERLTLRQEEIEWRGVAIECRVYAEDPDRQFLPSPGRITRLRTPAGPGIRDDSGVYEGWEVPLDYDPMISKLVAWGETREAAMARLRRALDEYHVGGIQTTLPFFKKLLLDPEFQAGEIDTGFIERSLSARTIAPSPSDALCEAQVAAAMVAALATTSPATPELSAPQPLTRGRATGADLLGERISSWRWAARQSSLPTRR
jgi:acetyl-CoA carboxylase biotin carboxylase subunit